MYRLEVGPENVATIHVSRTLTADDYQALVPELQRLIEEHGKIRLIWDMKNFEGWQPGALWQDAKFDLRHNDDVERIAMVGEARWENLMTQLMKPFAKAKVKYFDQAAYEDAQRWIQKGS